MTVSQNALNTRSASRSALAALIHESGIFDAEWYARRHARLPGVTADPLKHFLTEGVAAGLDPCALFSTKYYVDRYPEVLQSGQNALEHFLKYGGPENRAPHPLVAPHWLRQQFRGALPLDNPLLAWLRAAPEFGPRPLIDIDHLRAALSMPADTPAPRVVTLWQGLPMAARPGPHPLFLPDHVRRVAGLPGNIDPLMHFILNLGKAGSPHPLFDADHAWARNPALQIWDGELTLLERAILSAQPETLDTSPLFDVAHYTAQTLLGELDGQAPVLHYLTEGARRGLDPNPWFDEATYRERYLRDQPQEAGLVHYAVWYREPHITLAPRFPDRFYLSRYPEVATHFGASPLEHYLRFGRAEGRRIAEPQWQDDFASWDALRKAIHAAAPRLSAAEPEISVVIPVYNQFFYTLRCVWSLLAAGDAARMQVILADDGSSDETEAFFRSVPGLTYIRNPQNMGFLRSCNNAARSARAPFLFFLNNDTAVLPGALDALLATARALPDAGLVGAKLIYPDGSLQEAGGFVWQDGSGANLGRYGDPDEPGYNLRRDADYISGAAILVPRDLWETLGGFDERYVPAYYEDTDLAMRLHQLGWRVIYEPAAQVVHFEGISSGTSLESGVKAHQVVNRGKFLGKWDFALQDHLPAQQVDPRRIPRPARPRLLFIDHLVPEPDHDAGSVIVASYLRLLIELGYEVTFLPVNLHFNGRYGKMLQAMGVELLFHPYVSSIPDYLRDHAAAFDAFFLWRVNAGGEHVETLRRLCPGTPILFHTQDLHFLRMQRAAERMGNLPEEVQAAADMRERELRVMSLATETILVSTHEEAVLREIGCRASLSVVPLVLDPAEAPPPRSARSGIAFVGGFQHPPNVDAVRWFMADIYPLLREAAPDLEFHIVGSKPTPEILAIDVPGVTVHGFVEDLGAFLDQRLATVVPLQYGAGIKGKIGSSLAAGVPVVSTSLGAEGMGLAPETEVLLADTPQAFVTQILRLVEDEALWAAISAAGLAFVERSYSSRVTRERLLRLFAKAGVAPFAGRCPITGRQEARRFLDDRMADRLCAIPGGASSSERVLAAALARLAGHPGVPLSRLPGDSLPEVQGFGDLPVLRAALERVGVVRPQAQAPVALARIVLDATAPSTVASFQERIGSACTHLLLACPAAEKNPTARRSAPHVLTAMIHNLEKSGWTVRSNFLFLKECAMTDVALIEARRPPGA